MSELPYMSEHVADVMADSDELTNEELGAYVRLRRAMWRAGGYLPAKELRRFARAGKRWGIIAPMILSKLTIAEGKASCAQLLELLLRTRERRQKAAARGQKGAAARWSNGSAALQSSASVVPLKPAKSLISPELAVLEAMRGSSLSDGNQNQKSIESKSLPRTESSIFAMGERMIVERVGIRALAARSQVAKWLSAVGDENDLASILASAADENLRGARFVAVVDQRVRSAKECREKGMPLPFGFRPNVVSKK